MKKIITVIIITLALSSCKTTKHKCDAYGFNQEESDIHKMVFESQKKYSSYTVIK